MNDSALCLPHFLLADGDEERRASIRTQLAGQVVLLEASRAEEVLSALDASSPGVTLLDHRLPGARTAELVARILEVCPAEAVLVLASTPQVEFYRACMRAGAYDCIDRERLAVTELLEVCQSAARRAAERTRLLGASAQEAREVVHAHERAFAARLVTAELLEAWRRVDPGERSRLMAAHVQVAQHLGDPAEQEEALAALLRELEGRSEAALLLVGAHVHAVGSGRLDGANGDLERAGEALLLGLLTLSARHAASDAARGAELGKPLTLHMSPECPAPAQAQATWHRWRPRLGPEEWLLVADGRPLARLTPQAGACRAQLHEGARLVELGVSPLPNGLREVERRLGLAPVLSVCSLGPTA